MSPLPIDEPNDEEELEQEDQDYDTPFSPPDEERVSIEDANGGLQRPDLESTHPITDTDIEEGEVYDQGLAGAAGVSEPNANDAVTGYNPPRKPKSPTPDAE